MEKNQILDNIKNSLMKTGMPIPETLKTLNPVIKGTSDMIKQTSVFDLYKQQQAVIKKPATKEEKQLSELITSGKKATQEVQNIIQPTFNKLGKIVTSPEIKDKTIKIVNAPEAILGGIASKTKKLPNES
jgi:hypothetical protein